MTNDIVSNVIAQAGGLRALGDALGVSYQAVQSWRRNRIPAERVLEIEHLTGIPRERLRPDLYGAYTPAAKRKAR